MDGVASRKQTTTNTRSICRLNNYRLNRNKDGKDVCAHTNTHAHTHTHTHTHTRCAGRTAGVLRIKRDRLYTLNLTPPCTLWRFQTETRKILLTKMLSGRKKGRKEAQRERRSGT